METIQSLIESNRSTSEVVEMILPLTMRAKHIRESSWTGQTTIDEVRSWSNLEYEAGDRHNNGNPSPLHMDRESRLLRIYDMLVSIGANVDMVVEDISEDYSDCIALVVKT